MRNGRVFGKLTHTQTLMETGKRDELKNTYTYGNGRLDDTGVNGKTNTYLYDGRGSVAQVTNGSTVKQSLQYDSFGEIISGANENDIIFGYNGEEYNPVTNL